MQKRLNVTVVGAGLMGHGIAQVFAAANHLVTLTDSNEEVLHKAPAHISHNLVQMGGKALSVLRNLRLERDLKAAVAEADLVIEAAPERIELKQHLFREIAASAPGHAILASNTSVIPISEIGRELSDAAKARLLGTHWWNPPHLVPLVEVIRIEETSDDVFNETFALLEQVGKCPVKVHKDVPGFIGNRLQHALWREAISLVYRGVCDAKTIDIVVKQSFGMRLPVLGPMENADLVGLELTRNVHQLIFPDLDNSREPSPLLDDLLGQGNSGMRTGKGLRDWTQESADEVRNALAMHLITALGR
ncbi:3-hydroxyacyl-CoA dehydrogenase family protein [Cupriavidus sp. 2TAF22]|uniref:3-hydroxyacyl-CoA dehydrogenase family protein n=1 Tax=unclassified Cupriavidus TaxID=2640874 RepID=UPI003F8FEC2F